MSQTAVYVEYFDYLLPSSRCYVHSIKSNCTNYYSLLLFVVKLQWLNGVYPVYFFPNYLLVSYSFEVKLPNQQSYVN